MHEFGITERLFQIALTQANLRDDERIRCLHINLDPDSGYTTDAIRFYFEQLAKNTPAEGAELNFELISQPRHITLQHVEIDEAATTGSKEAVAKTEFPLSSQNSPHPSTVGSLHGIARWRLQVSSIGYDVGFQTFLYILTHQLDLSGWLRPTATGVELELQGPVDELDHFLHHLRHDAPPPTRILEIDTTPLPPRADQSGGLEIQADQN
jgi:Zn finger protein HypA/HybF involved in hydrogenase expression/acylphosphatase